MRRVFPVRPSETSLLVTYRNETFEHDIAGTLEPHYNVAADVNRDRQYSRPIPATSATSGCSVFAKSSARHGHRSSEFSTIFQVDNGKSFDMAPQEENDESQKVSSTSYPEFVETLSHSFREDGDTTSFAFSDDGPPYRGTSSSFSSSSSITYNPRDGGRSAVTLPHSDTDPLLDTASSSFQEPKILEDAEISSIADVDSCHVNSQATGAIFEPPLKPLKPIQVTVPRPSTRPDNSPRVSSASFNQKRLSGSTSTPKVRYCERVGSHGCLPNSSESTSQRSKTPQPGGGSVRSHGCGSSLRNLMACLRAETSSETAKKHKVPLQQLPNSPGKFSTLLNQLHSPPSPFLSKSQTGGRVTKGHLVSQNSSKVLGTGAPRRCHVGETGLNVSETASVSDNRGISPAKSQQLGRVLVDNYVERARMVGKSSSFCQSPKSSCFQYKSEPRRGIRRACSMEFPEKLIDEGTHGWLKKQNNSSFDSPSSLSDASEKNAQILAQLRMEINKLCKEKRYLAMELQAAIKARISEQKATQSAIKHIEEEMEGKLISAEKKHAHVQECLENEMERRKKEWSAKLEKIRLEEKRLRERVTEMAVERVELQKAIASYKTKEAALQSQARDCEVSMQTWRRRFHQSEEEVHVLRQSFGSVCGKWGEKERELDLLSQKTKDLEMENAELVKEVGRLRRAYAEQETRFEELWESLIEIVNRPPSECKVESLRRFHRELRAFATNEQALRSDISALQFELAPQSSQKDCFVVEEGEEVYSDRLSATGYDSNAKKSPSLQLKVDNLVKKFDLSKQHAGRVECQLEVRDEEVHLLRSALQEREDVVQGLQGELMWVKAQRDGLRKQVHQMSQEAGWMTRELSQLRKVVEKLDDELMLKEGQISILRETCSDSDFCD